jgi:ankyrin repeat protein
MSRRRIPTQTARAAAIVLFRWHCRKTPLHEAARFGKYDVVRLLVANGADVTASNNEGSVEYSRRRCTIGFLIASGQCRL